MSRIARVAEVLATRVPRITEDPTRKPAAVAVVLVPDPDAILLIRRAVREGDVWSGQMAFPGGRWSPDDPDLETTARRETAEEVGLDLADAARLGRLDDLLTRTPTLPPVTVSPFVYALDGRRPLVPNHEVAEALWVPLDLLRSAGIYRPFEYDRGGVRVTFPGYHLETGTVWGMTERVLTPLLELIPD